MGLTFVDGIVKGKGKKRQKVRFLVDSGATYTLLPEKIWHVLGLKPDREMTFTLADGTMVKRGISECWLELPQGRAHTPVIMGEKEDEALLGAVSLEIVGLVLNPFNRTLQPMRMMLA